MWVPGSIRMVSTRTTRLSGKGVISHFRIQFKAVATVGIIESLCKSTLTCLINSRMLLDKYFTSFSGESLLISSPGTQNSTPSVRRQLAEVNKVSSILKLSSSAHFSPSRQSYCRRNLLAQVRA